MPFVKGKSGNPGGRPKALKDVENLARKHSSTAIQTLADICMDGDAPPAARVSASSALLDRGWGKPPQQNIVTGENGGPVLIATGVPRQDDAADD